MAISPTLEANAQALERELIIYEKGIPELLELDTPLLSMMDKEESDPASNRPTRIPLLTAIQGTFQQVSMDNASLGTSSGPVWNVATLAPYYFTGGYSYSALADYATVGGARGVKSAASEVMRVSIEQFKAAIDMLLNTAGNGVTATITSVATNTFTLTTDGFREELFYYGQNIQVYNAALTTNRGTSTVTAIDRVGHTITVAAAPGGTIATDLIVIGGLSGTLTNQSSLFGVQYHQSDATSGTWLNLNRATVPNVVTPSVNANNSGLTTAFIRAALNRIRMNLGDNYFNSGEGQLVPYMHPAQADAYEGLAITISQIFKDPSGNQGVDLMFGNQNNLTMSGLKVKQSIHQDRTRIDFLSMKFWGRIVATDTGFYKVGDQIIFPVYNGTGDGLNSAKFFYLKAGLQVFNRNPLSGSYVKALSVPAGAIY
jgi:hypothetical protein